MKGMNKILVELLSLKRILLFSVVPKLLRYEIQLETTNYCNAKCVFCPNPTLKRNRVIMDDRIFMKVISRLKDEKIAVSRFILHLNGEPLTDNKLFERIKIIKRNFPKAEIRFTTNFCLATKTIRTQIIDSQIDEITISLNSIDPEEYQKIMGLSYQRTIENVREFLKEIKESNSKLKVNFSIVARPENKEMVLKFKDEFGNNGRIRIIRLGNWVNENGNEVIRKDASRICMILYKTINILSNGDYALCCFDAEGIIKMNINDTGIMEAFRSEQFQRIRKYHIKNRVTNLECAGCSFN